MQVRAELLCACLAVVPGLGRTQSRTSLHRYFAWPLQGEVIDNHGHGSRAGYRRRGWRHWLRLGRCRVGRGVLRRSVCVEIMMGVSVAGRYALRHAELQAIRHTGTEIA